MVSEDHEVVMPRIVGRVTVKPFGFFGGAKLLVDGQPAPAGGQPAQLRAQA
ncbi:MAG: hypothetical protein GW913_03670 [Myxococcales bacterium]|nr:hypothetical protein [Myxococcales bacterium]